jgi:DNA-directed RNA polymerase subunit RPC12/RpoP
LSGKYRNLTLGVVSVGLLGLAAALYFARAGGEAEYASTYTMDGVCLKCSQEVVATYEAGNRAVGRCPNCDSQTVYSWMHCKDCLKRFVPNLVASSSGGPPVPPVVPTCTGCGSNNTGAWVPDLPGMESAGDVPLPKLP